MIYGLHVTTSWVKCPLWVNQPVQLSLLSLRMAVRHRSKSVAADLAYGLQAVCPLCDEKRRCNCGCSLWRYIRVMPLPLYFYYVA